MDKRMSKRIVIALSVLALLAIAVGVGAVFVSCRIEPSSNAETVENTDRESSFDIIETNADENKESDTSDMLAPVSIPELNDGNEVYLDIAVLSKLQEIEDAGGEDMVNEIFDTMFLLINEFADRGYSKLAIYQIQRFYFICFDSLRGVELDILCEKINECISAEGADESDFEGKVKEQFGFEEDIALSFVFEAEVSS